MNFFYQPSPPPTTIDSGHSEFMKLSYSDRIDRCVPYISEYFDTWRDRWRTTLNDTGGSHQKSPVPYAALGDANAAGQAIVNTYLAVVNYAEKLAPTDEGENLLSCVYAPALRMDPNHSYPDVESLVGSGDAAPKADNLVVPKVRSTSRANSQASQPRAREQDRRGGHPTRPSETHRQLGFAMVSGHEQGVRMWALTASVKPVTKRG